MQVIRVEAPAPVVGERATGEDSGVRPELRDGANALRSKTRSTDNMPSSSVVTTSCHAVLSSDQGQRAPVRS